MLEGQIISDPVAAFHRAKTAAVREKKNDRRTTTEKFPGRSSVQPWRQKGQLNTCSSRLSQSRSKMVNCPLPRGSCESLCGDEQKLVPHKAKGRKDPLFSTERRPHSSEAHREESGHLHPHRFEEGNVGVEQSSGVVLASAKLRAANFFNATGRMTVLAGRCAGCSPTFWRAPGCRRPSRWLPPRLLPPQCPGSCRSDFVEE